MITLIKSDRTMVDRILGKELSRFDISWWSGWRIRRQYSCFYHFVKHHESPDIGPALLYVQGSSRLGTVIPPVRAEDDFDLDVVLSFPLARQKITERLERRRVPPVKGGVRQNPNISEPLMNYAGEMVDQFVAIHSAWTFNRQGRRCWTLRYRLRRFHLDVLPAIPDWNDNAPPHGLRITDQANDELLHSNPAGYAEWFYSQMCNNLKVRAAVWFARHGNRDAQNKIPLWIYKSTLQREVQFLKLHRDAYFTRNPGPKPPSIVITTLAALAYSGEDSIYESLCHTVNTMEKVAKRGVRNNHHLIKNPAQPRENFADRWNTHADQKKMVAKFFEWLDKLKADLNELSSTDHKDTIRQSVRKALDRKVDETATAPDFTTPPQQSKPTNGNTTIPTPPPLPPYDRPLPASPGPNTPNEPMHSTRDDKRTHGTAPAPRDSSRHQTNKGRAENPGHTNASAAHKAQRASELKHDAVISPAQVNPKRIPENDINRIHPRSTPPPAAITPTHPAISTTVVGSLLLLAEGSHNQARLAEICDLVEASGLRIVRAGFITDSRLPELQGAILVESITRNPAESGSLAKAVETLRRLIKSRYELENLGKLPKDVGIATSGSGVTNTVAHSALSSIERRKSSLNEPGTSLIRSTRPETSESGLPSIPLRSPKATRVVKTPDEVPTRYSFSSEGVSEPKGAYPIRAPSVDMPLIDASQRDDHRKFKGPAGPGIF